MKRTYHTNLQIKYLLGLLDKEIVSRIPSSTLYNWRKKGFGHIFGLPDINEKDITVMKEFLSKKKLLRAAKALYYIYSVYQRIIFTSSKIRKQFLKYSEEIIHTIDLTKGALGLDKAFKMFMISPSTYYYWKNKINCTNSLLKLCRTRHPQQLTNNEVSVIKDYLIKKEFINWSLASVYYKQLRDKAAGVSIGTFYKYAKLLKLSRQKHNHRRKKHTVGIRAEKPLQILHADLTIFRPLDNTKVYIYFIADNFSRKILAWKASLKYSAKYTFQNLKEVLENYNINSLKQDVDFIVDGGSENKAEVDSFIQNSNINKVIAQKDIVYSNSMVEAVNKRIKYDFLFPYDIQNFEQTINHLEKAVGEYNNKPYHPLHGLTPNEVFEGQMPDKNMFRNHILEARQLRIQINRVNQCDNHR